jgi:hypothetical protein
VDGKPDQEAKSVILAEEVDGKPDQEATLASCGPHDLDEVENWLEVNILMMVA